MKGQSIFRTIYYLPSITPAVASAVVWAQILNPEFGVLNALGFGHLQLVWRVARETAAVVVAAWLLSLALCAAGLLSMQFGLYAPLGFRLDFFNPTPWLFTLPIPVAVLAASAGTIAWTLARLDPVAIIERR